MAGDRPPVGVAAAPVVAVPAPRVGALPAQWRASLRVAALALLTTRLVVWAAGIAGVEGFGLSSRAHDFDPLGLTSGFGSVGDVLVAPAARWDATWYLQIAHQGYADTTHAAFFPLYPFLARAAGAPVGSSLAGGLVVSLACGVAAFAALHRLTSIELGEGAATAAVWLLACFPAAIFLSAVYSESLFLALSVGSVLAARTGRWWWAGALGALAAATRSAGVVLVVPLVLLWWRAAPRRPRDLLALALVPAGLAAFCAGLALGGLDAMAPFHAQDEWFRHFAGPFVGARDGAVAAWDGARQLLSGSRTPVFFTLAGGDPYANAAHNLELFAALVAAVPMALGALRRLPLAYGAYAVAALALPLSWPVTPQPLMSLPRFVLVLFPLFMWLGWWAARGRLRLYVLAGAFLALQAVAAAEFATWHWFRVTRVVLLDALGTLLELEDPGPPLAAALTDLGAPVSVDDARGAVLAEMTYYKAHHDEGSDPQRLAALRRRCAEVLRDALPPGARELGLPALTGALLEALRFAPFPEVPETLARLRASGLSLVVVSNWDVSLHEQLAATGLDRLVNGAVSSAEAGAGKPEPALYERALALAGATVAQALMVGDSPDTDIAGAVALGIDAVLVNRWGTAGPAPGARRITTLAELPALIESTA